jgi:phage repressor protein C with HTH and peptisase S24 domain
LPRGKYRAFPLRGDSMLPLGDGCYVVGKFTESIEELKNGKTYILLTTNDGIVYKRVFNKIRKDGKIHLHSDNPSFKP